MARRSRLNCSSSCYYASLCVGGRVEAELMMMPWRPHVRVPMLVHAIGLWKPEAIRSVAMPQAVLRAYIPQKSIPSSIATCHTQ